MPERSVIVRLKAETSQFTTKMVAAGRTASKALDGATSATDKQRAALRDVGNAAGIMGGLFAAGVGFAVKAAADFDQGMSNVQAATHATTGTMHQLREAALKAGADTAFSATEAADGIAALSKAGVSAKDILGGGLRGALSLAAAGQIDVGDAAEAAATAMTQFGLSGGQVPHVADLLAAAAGKAQGEVGDFSQALNQSGLVANQTGLSIEETTGALAAFASQGLIGSDAGTSLKTMLQSLTPSSDKAAKAMADLNISAYDQKGQFIGLQEWAGKLRSGLSGLSDEQRNSTLKTIFGSDAVRAATVIYDQGAKGIKRWTANVNDQGFAAETAAIKMDNLHGDLEQLKGSIETALIGAGEGAQSPLRGLAHGATDVVNAFNKLPEPMKAAGFQLGALGAAAGGSIFLGAHFLSSVGNIRQSITDLGLSAGKTKLAMRGFVAAGAGLAVLTVGVGVIKSLQEALDDAEPGASVLALRLRNMAADGTVGALGANFDDLGESLNRIGDRSTGQSITDALQTPFEKLVGEAGSLRQARSDIMALDSALNQLAVTKGPKAAERAIQQLAQQWHLSSGQVRILRGELPQLNDTLASYRLNAQHGTKATKDATTWAGFFGDAMKGTKGPIRGSAKAMDDGADAARNLKYRMESLSAELEKRSTWRDYQAAIDDATKAARKSGAQISANTPKGRALADSLDAIASSALGWAKQMGNTEKANKFMANAKQRYIETAVAMGKNREAAKRLADSIFGIPKKQTTKPDFEDRPAKRAIDVYTGDIGDIPDNPLTTPLFNADPAANARDRFVEGTKAKFKSLSEQTYDILMHGTGGGKGQGLGVLANANGNILRFANGAENHTAMIAGPGTPTRIWNEPETEGELYAPLAKSKRPRSRKIMEEGARLMGGNIEWHADGGIRADPRVRVKADMSDAAKYVSAYVKEIRRYLMSAGGGMTPGQVARGQAFARREAGKPYIWGGVGPAGYDCSGFQGAVFNYARGQNPHTRLFTTASLPMAGMQPGNGAYTVGWFTGNPGHVSGRIGNLNVESTNGSVRVGSAARGPDDSLFNRKAHFTTAAGRKYGGGAGGEFSGQYGKGNRGIVRSIAGHRGWDTGSQWSSLQNIINAESTWRPQADNPSGSASGLYGMIDSTWQAYRRGSNASRARFAPVSEQAQAGDAYIKATYGGPVAAWKHHQAVGTYGDGGINVRSYDDAPVLRPGWTMAYNGTGRNEHIVKMADGGIRAGDPDLTPAERRERRQEHREKLRDARQERREKRQETRQEAREKAREEAQEKRQAAREAAQEARQLHRERFFARKRGLRNFDIGGKETESEVRSELTDLRVTLREAFGRDSGAVKALNRLDGRLLKVSEKHDKLIRTEEKLSENISGLKQKQAQFSADVRGAYEHDLFTGGLADFNLQARADENDARRSRRMLMQAHHRGLGGSLFRQLEASGNTSLISEFAHLSRRQIARQERQFAQRQHATHALARYAGREAYGDQMREELAERRHNTRNLRENTRQMKRLARVTEHEVARRTGGARKRARSG